MSTRDERTGGEGERERLLDMAFAFWRSSILLTADEIGLFSVLGETPCDAAALAARLGMCPDEIAGYLDALVALDLLAHHDGIYHTRQEVARYLDARSPSYLGQSLAMARAALADTHEFGLRLRAARAHCSAQQTLRERMWADIAAVLQATGADTIP